MTGLILVVDDLPPNVKLLEAKLSAEYYDIITAFDGFQAIEKAKQQKPDIILLDVMMPGMDGFETCRKLKADPDVAHIPVVMVTALNDPSDRVKGLDAGADDFLTKPVNDVALFARVKSLIRMKVLFDELRLRDQTGNQVGAITGQGLSATIQDVSGARVLVIDDDALEASQIRDHVSGQYHLDVEEDPEKALQAAYSGGYDLIILSSLLTAMDSLRLVSHLRSHEQTRHLPILILIDEDDQRTLVKGLEMGVNDYLITPIDPNELVVRCRTQIRRKRYQDALKDNYKQSVSMAVTDSLTKLFNRHYLNAHLENMLAHARSSGKPLSLLIMDMDHFKSVNDTYGHDAGDAVLVQLAQIIQKCIRSSDLAARFGGEEFVVVMPETAYPDSSVVAERIRSAVEKADFVINHPESPLHKTLSIGHSMFGHGVDTAESLLKRADEALYRAKHGGRNRIEVGLPEGAPAGNIAAGQS